MKKQFLKASVGLALLATAQMAGAATLPTTGLDADFGWYGLGPIDYIVGDTGTTWDITVATASVLSVAAAQDDYIVGDEFALTLDGIQQAWTIETTVGSYFSGILVNLFLSAGFHQIGFNVTQLAPGYNGGEAHAQFGKVSPSPVPLPAAALLFGSALLGAGALGRKRKEEQAGALAVA